MAGNVERRNELVWAFIFLAPGLIAFIAFLLGPIFYSLFVSFFRWDLLNPMRFVGLENYRRLLFEDPQMGQVAWNTVLFLIYVVPIAVFAPLVIAVMLARTHAIRRTMQSIYFLPLVSSNVAIALVWRWIFSRRYGLLNAVLSLFINENIHWLGDTQYALLSISTIVVWKTIPLNIILFYAAVTDVPRQLYESAMIDGCRELKLFTHITFPLVSPVTFFVFILTLITCFFNGFDVIRVLTQGGPINSTNIFVYYLYETAFQNQRMGYASAISFVFFVFILVFTLLQFRLQKKWVHY